MMDLRKRQSLKSLIRGKSKLWLWRNTFVRGGMGKGFDFTFSYPFPFTESTGTGFCETYVSGTLFGQT
jgi:hypothetical protein